MKEVKIYARAGQGAITTAAILGEALFHENKYAYVFPHFGAARMGAPMNAFLRFDSRPIRLRTQVYQPEYIIIIDPTLIESQKCFNSLQKEAKAIVTVRDTTQLLASNGVTIYPLAAESIAMDILGKPYANTVLLGAFAKATGEVGVDALKKAVKARFEGKPELLEKNLQALQKGFESV